jgi:hypothetical protein
VRLWADLNENGQLDTNELQSVGSGITAADYGFYSRGNGKAAGAKLSAAPAPGVGSVGNRPQAPSTTAPGNSLIALPGAPAYGGVPDSNYRTLRDTDNLYINLNQFAYLFNADAVKINNGNRTYLIGTDGADNFDGSYFAAYPQYFNSSLLVNFLGGGGNDALNCMLMRCANDNFWRKAA